MKQVNDSVFGIMEYNYAWEKTDVISAFGRDFEVKVVAEANDNQDIIDVQRKAYSTYLNNFTRYMISIPDVLLDYYKTNYNSISSNVNIPERININNINKELIVKLIKIRSVYFSRKGTYGWLCECAWEPEHGIAIVLSTESPLITEQDYLI